MCISCLAFWCKSIFFISNLKSKSVIVWKMTEVEKPPKANIYRNPCLCGFDGRGKAQRYHIIVILKMTVTGSIIDSLLTFTWLKAASLSGTYTTYVSVQHNILSGNLSNTTFVNLLIKSRTVVCSLCYETQIKFHFYSKKLLWIRISTPPSYITFSETSMTEENYKQEQKRAF